MELLSLVDELNAILRQARHVPASSKIMVDESAMRRIVNEMRAALTDEPVMNPVVAAERDRVISDARNLARRVLDDAQSRASSLLDEQSIVQAARERAQDIQQDAMRYAAHIRSEADHYVALQLSSLENRLFRVLREVQAGRRSLSPDAAETEETG